MHPQSSSPLVARRQQQTWTAIHRAAAAAALERGLDGVTVAQIAQSAGISPRTFFNYFESKEDAIVGVRAPRLDDEMMRRLRDSTDVSALQRVSRLVTDVSRSTIGPGVDVEQRHELAVAHPQLRQRLIQVFSDSRKHLLGRLVDDIDRPWQGIAGLPPDPQEARALILLAGAVVTFAWMTDADRMLSDTEAALEAAIVIFVKVTTTPS